MNSNFFLDIAPEDLKIVLSILHQWVPNHIAWAFGSRVKGNARKFSDLDLVLLTSAPLPFDVYAGLKEAFSESSLPFKVDVVDWSLIDDNFREIIREYYIQLPA